MEYVCLWCVFGVTLITALYSLASLLLLWSSVKANPLHGPGHSSSSAFLHLPSPSLGQGPWAQLSTAVIPWALISRVPLCQLAYWWWGCLLALSPAPSSHPITVPPSGGRAEGLYSKRSF